MLSGFDEIKSKRGRLVHSRILNYGQFKIALRSERVEILQILERYFQCQLEEEVDFIIDISIDIIFDLETEDSIRDLASRELKVLYKNDLIFRGIVKEERSILSTSEGFYDDKFSIYRERNTINLIFRDYREDHYRYVIRAFREFYIKYYESIGGHVLHSSSFVLEGKGTACVGNSGAGKSTYLMEMMKRGLSRVSIVSGDRCILLEKDGVPYMFPILQDFNLHIHTVRNLGQLTKYFKDKIKTFRGEPFDQFIKMNFDESKKLLVAPWEISETFGVSYKYQARLDNLVFPNISYMESVDYKKALWRNIYTPVDPDYGQGIFNFKSLSSEKKMVKKFSIYKTLLRLNRVLIKGGEPETFDNLFKKLAEDE